MYVTFADDTADRSLEQPAVMAHVFAAFCSPVHPLYGGRFRVFLSKPMPLQ